MSWFAEWRSSPKAHGAGARDPDVEHRLGLAEVSGRRLVVIPDRPRPHAATRARAPPRRSLRPPGRRSSGRGRGSRADRSPRHRPARTRSPRATTPSCGIKRTSVGPARPSYVATGATCRRPTVPRMGADAMTWLEWRSPRYATAWGSSAACRAASAARPSRSLPDVSSASSSTSASLRALEGQLGAAQQLAPQRRPPVRGAARSRRHFACLDSEPCRHRPTRARNASVSSRRGSATRAAFRGCSTPPSTSPA